MNNDQDLYRCQIAAVLAGRQVASWYQDRDRCLSGELVAVVSVLENRPAASSYQDRDRPLSSAEYPGNVRDERQ